MNTEPPLHVVTVPAPSQAAFGDDLARGFRDAVDGAAELLKSRGYSLAALVCDSIFSSDGVYADPSGFLGPAVVIARAHGGLYIADEVQPGFARTGSGFWGYEHHGVEPDMVTMGKPMGNGYPMAGVAAKTAHFRTFCSDVGYFNTFGGSPVAAAAGQAVLQVIEDEGLQENARVIGTHLCERVQAIAERSNSIAEVRQQGLFMGIELAEERDIARPDPALAARTIDGLRARRVLIGAAGKYGNTLKVRPPLSLSMDEADIFADALAAELCA